MVFLFSTSFCSILTPAWLLHGFVEVDFDDLASSHPTPKDFYQFKNAGTAGAATSLVQRLLLDIWQVPATDSTPSNLKVAGCSLCRLRLQLLQEDAFFSNLRLKSSRRTEEPLHHASPKLYEQHMRAKKFWPALAWRSAEQETPMPIGQEAPEKEMSCRNISALRRSSYQFAPPIVCHSFQKPG